jgi:carbon-monoxide dehydrogenase small subunit
VTRHDTRRPLALHVNGVWVQVGAEPRRTLADTLREDLGLTGTHLGCEQGVCGSCTILLDGEPVRSCLVLAAQADGRSVRTVEGLAREDGELHPLQAAFVECHALQCGFCTPGFLMLLAGTIEADPAVPDAVLLQVVSSNLCRCTGYAPIVDAARSARDRGLPPPPGTPSDALAAPGADAAAPRARRTRSPWAARQAALGLSVAVAAAVAAAVGVVVALRRRRLPGTRRG